MPDDGCWYRVRYERFSDDKYFNSYYYGPSYHFASIRSLKEYPDNKYHPLNMRSKKEMIFLEGNNGKFLTYEKTILTNFELRKFGLSNIKTDL